MTAEITSEETSPRPLVPLTGRQRRQLRALGHHLKPVVMIGKEGLSEPVRTQLERELLAHELVKIRVLDTAPDKASEIAEVLAEMTESQVAQVLGKTALLYRARPESPDIELET